MPQEQAIEYALATPQTPEETETAYPAGLSLREVEVLRLVAKGMTNAEIAKALFIGPRTVNGDGADQSPALWAWTVDAKQ
ncbi:MAG TPA: helix-turn-helix transcriptional regulator [Rubrobacter sp.]|nr:helix-turn-helix transcriptional regulator [Rubrobacter sp.]HYQ83431.1 helix-turn-helix transcriptional regulator [Rubrobacter sp.]